MLTTEEKKFIEVWGAPPSLMEKYFFWGFTPFAFFICSVCLFNSDFEILFALISILLFMLCLIPIWKIKNGYRQILRKILESIEQTSSTACLDKNSIELTEDDKKFIHSLKREELKIGKFLFKFGFVRQMAFLLFGVFLILIRISLLLIRGQHEGISFCSLMVYFLLWCIFILILNNRGKNKLFFGIIKKFTQGEPHEAESNLRAPEKTGEVL